MIFPFLLTPANQAESGLRPTDPQLPAIQVNQGEVQGQEQRWAIGDLQLVLESLKTQLENQKKTGSDAAFTMPEGWNSLEVLCRKHSIEVDFDGDGNKDDRLILIDYVIGVASYENPKTISFLLRVDGEGLRGTPVEEASYQMLMGAVSVVDVAERNGMKNPFEDFSIRKKSGRDVVDYWVQDDPTSTIYAKNKTVDAEPLSLSWFQAQRLDSSLDEVVSYIHNHLDPFYLPRYVAIDGQAEGYYTHQQVIKEKFLKSVELPLLGLMHFVNSSTFTTLDPVLKTRLRTAGAWANEEIENLKEIKAGLNPDHWEKSRKVRNDLRALKPELTSQALKDYRALMLVRREALKILNKDSDVNDASYVRYKMKKNGFSYEELKGLNADFIKKEGEKAKALIVELKKYKKAKEKGIPMDQVADVADVELHHEEIYSLFPEYFKSLEAPRINAEKVEEIMTRFFKDMGIDLNEAPFNRILLDFRNRKQKRDGMSTIFYNRSSYVNTQVKDQNSYTLDELATIAHEMIHGVHMVLSADANQASRMRGYFASPQSTVEGFAFVFNRLIITPAFIKSYLSDVDGYNNPQVSDKVVTALAGRFACLQVFNSANALMEVELEDRVYAENNISMEDHLKTLQEKYYAPFGLIPNTSLISRAMLGVERPGYAGAYPWGYMKSIETVPSLYEAFFDESGDPRDQVDLENLKKAGLQIIKAFKRGDHDFDPNKSFRILGEK